MRHIAVLILIAFGFPTTVRAAYVITNFVDLAGNSDAIVVGTIAEVAEDTYSLTVEEVLAGAVMEGEALTVRRFRDWLCAWRWADYEVGQKLLVFLNRGDKGKVWVSRGAAGEGESPIVENEVHANFGVPGETIEYKGPFGKCCLSAVRFDQVRTAILDFRAAFRVVPAKDPWQDDGGCSVYVPFERIESISNPGASTFRHRPAPPQFWSRSPRALKFPPARASSRASSDFRTRSPLHRKLVEIVETERNKIQKYKVK